MPKIPLFEQNVQLNNQPVAELRDPNEAAPVYNAIRKLADTAVGLGEKFDQEKQKSEKVEYIVDREERFEAFKKTAASIQDPDELQEFYQKWSESESKVFQDTRISRGVRRDLENNNALFYGDANKVINGANGLHRKREIEKMAKPYYKAMVMAENGQSYMDKETDQVLEPEEAHAWAVDKLVSLGAIDFTKGIQEKVSFSRRLVRNEEKVARQKLDRDVMNNPAETLKIIDEQIASGGEGKYKLSPSALRAGRNFAQELIRERVVDDEDIRDAERSRLDSDIAKDPEKTFAAINEQLKTGKGGYKLDSSDLKTGRNFAQKLMGEVESEETEQEDLDLKAEKDKLIKAAKQDPEKVLKQIDAQLETGDGPFNLNTRELMKIRSVPRQFMSEARKAKADEAKIKEGELEVGKDRMVRSLYQQAENNPANTIKYIDAEIGSGRSRYDIEDLKSAKAYAEKAVRENRSDAEKKLYADIFKNPREALENIESEQETGEVYYNVGAEQLMAGASRARQQINENQSKAFDEIYKSDSPYQSMKPLEKEKWLQDQYDADNLTRASFQAELKRVQTPEIRDVKPEDNKKFLELQADIHAAKGNEGKMLKVLNDVTSSRLPDSMRSVLFTEARAVQDPNSIFNRPSAKFGNKVINDFFSSREDEFAKKHTRLALFGGIKGFYEDDRIITMLRAHAEATQSYSNWLNSYKGIPSTSEIQDNAFDILEGTSKFYSIKSNVEDIMSGGVTPTIEDEESQKAFWETLDANP